MIEKYKRHNWNDLQVEFIQDKYESLKEFAKIKGLNYKSSQFFVNTKGWLKLKDIINLNPLLLKEYSLCLNRILEEIPKCFYIIKSDIWLSAALTFIADTRRAACSIEQISKWYGLNPDEVKSRAKNNRWNYYRQKEKSERNGTYLFMDTITEV